VLPMSMKIASSSLSWQCGKYTDNWFCIWNTPDHRKTQHTVEKTNWR